jgi:chromosome segregation ATPase
MRKINRLRADKIIAENNQKLKDLNSESMEIYNRSATIIAEKDAQLSELKKKSEDLETEILRLTAKIKEQKSTIAARDVVSKLSLENNSLKQSLLDFSNSTSLTIALQTQNALLSSELMQARSALTYYQGVVAEITKYDPSKSSSDEKLVPSIIPGQNFSFFQPSTSLPGTSPMGVPISADTRVRKKNSGSSKLSKI